MGEQVIALLVHRGLPAQAGTANRTFDAPEASPESVPGARLGAPAGVSASVSQELMLRCHV